MGKKKVVVAMSGGVDSSAALALLVQEGYECIGVTMQLWDYSKKDDPEGVGAGAGSCCSLDDVGDARRVADNLGVPFYVVNVEEAFKTEVVDYFVEGYSAGTTPNPCIKCNQVLKFEVLMNKALALGADYLATGHYARINRDGPRPRLFKGIDAAKDQSYFLFTMTPPQLERVLFPLGALTKDEVRKLAKKAGLKTHDKEESQDICFVEDAGYAEFLSGRIPATEGEIVDTGGAVLGEHAGLFNYTIGQRKGLGLSGGPFYVLGMEMDANRLVVGTDEGLDANGLIAKNCNWIDPEAEALSMKNGGLEGISSKIRYRHPGVGSTVRSTEDGRVKVEFETPQRAVTPGQAVVFYKDDEVVGGGWIEEAI